MERIICIIIGYVFGLFQTGFIYGKMKHIDIRDYGSGNAGTTNTMRVLGKKAGFITYFGDALKAIFACVFIRIIYRDQSDMMFLYGLYTGLGVILGHNFPFYMQFKGGKGIASSSGAIVGLLDWKLIVLAAGTFFGVMFRSKYVSLASLCCLGGFFIEVVLFGQLDMLPGLLPANRMEAYVIAFIWTLLAFIRHKDNIKRLKAGTERKIGQKKEQV